MRRFDPGHRVQPQAGMRESSSGRTSECHSEDVGSNPASGEGTPAVQQATPRSRRGQSYRKVDCPLHLLDNSTHHCYHIHMMDNTPADESNRMSYRVKEFTRSDGRRSSSLLGPEGVVVPVNQMITNSLLTDHTSAHTIRAWCHDLKLWFSYLELRNLAWDEVTWNGDNLLAHYVSWLRTGSLIPISERVVQVEPTPIRSDRTVARALSSLYAFYDFQDHTPFARSMRDYRSAFLNRHARSLGQQRRTAARPIKTGASNATRPEALTRDQLEEVKAACDCHRDRFLIALLSERGLRVGGALGLRHEDIDSRAKTYSIVPRDDNPNGALAKVDRPWVLPMRDDHLRLHKRYMFEEYGDTDCGFVFINLHGPRSGQPMTYEGVRAVAEKLGKRTGIPFTPHVLRHTFATNAILDGVPLEVVQSMLTHKDPKTTSQTYIHLHTEHLRRALASTEPGGQA